MIETTFLDVTGHSLSCSDRYYRVVGIRTNSSLWSEMSIKRDFLTPPYGLFPLMVTRELSKKKFPPEISIKAKLIKFWAIEIITSYMVGSIYFSLLSVIVLYIMNQYSLLCIYFSNIKFLSDRSYRTSSLALKIFLVLINRNIKLTLNWIHIF